MKTETLDLSANYNVLAPTGDAEAFHVHPVEDGVTLYFSADLYTPEQHDSLDAIEAKHGGNPKLAAKMKTARADEAERTARDKHQKSQPKEKGDRPRTERRKAKAAAREAAKVEAELTTGA